MCQLLLSNVQMCLWLCHHIQICCSPAGFGVRIYVLFVPSKLLRVALKNKLWVLGASGFLPFFPQRRRRRRRRRGSGCLQPHFPVCHCTSRGISSRCSLPIEPHWFERTYFRENKFGNYSWANKFSVLFWWQGVGAVPAPWLWFSWDWQHCLWV